ncbi:uncharacterized protein [Lolium perenne]|uniref:uncharacterized protein n=1 Tax=Lolium perenne TaxID=4522 RepID=UPI0021F598C4|nr:uncharacterized protein LOC127348457 [Lolium perenne]
MSVTAASRGVRALAVLGRCVRAPFRVLLRARDLYVRQMTTCAAGRGPVGMVSVPRSRSHAFYRSAGDGDDGDVLELVRAASRARCSSVAARSQSMDIGRIDEDQPCEFGTGGGAMRQALDRRSRSCAVGSMGMSMGRSRAGAVAAA